MLCFVLVLISTSCYRKKHFLQFVSEWKNNPQVDRDKKKPLELNDT